MEEVLPEAKLTLVDKLFITGLKAVGIAAITLTAVDVVHSTVTGNASVSSYYADANAALFGALAYTAGHFIKGAANERVELLRDERRMVAKTEQYTREYLNSIHTY